MPHGKICCLEVPAMTGKVAAEFRQTIFGWKVRPRGDGNLAFDDSGAVSGTAAFADPTGNEFGLYEEP